MKCLFFFTKYKSYAIEQEIELKLIYSYKNKLPDGLLDFWKHINTDTILVHNIIIK